MVRRGLTSGLSLNGGFTDHQAVISGDTHLSLAGAAVRILPPTPRSPCWKTATAPKLDCGFLQGNSSKQGKQVLDVQWVSLPSLFHTLSTSFTFTRLER